VSGVSRRGEDNKPESQRKTFHGVGHENVRGRKRGGDDMCTYYQFKTHGQSQDQEKKRREKEKSRQILTVTKDEWRAVLGGKETTRGRKRE